MSNCRICGVECGSKGKQYSHERNEHPIEFKKIVEETKKKMEEETQKEIEVTTYSHKVANGFLLTRSGGIHIDEIECGIIMRGLEKLQKTDKYDTFSIFEYKEPIPIWVQFLLAQKLKLPENIHAEITGESQKILLVVGMKSLKKAPFLIKLLESQRKENK